MNHYSFYNMSKKSQNAAGITLKSIAHIAENFLFFYLGMVLFHEEVIFFSLKQ